MLRCGLLGETLGHSYSPMIHHELGEYDYRLFEVSKADLDAFLRSNRWDGLNVTIPYKRDVMPLCDEIDPAAEAIGSVNTIVRCADGKLVGTGILTETGEMALPDGAAIKLFLLNGMTNAPLCQSETVKNP